MSGDLKHDLLPTLQYALGVLTGIVAMALGFYLFYLLTVEPIIQLADYLNFLTFLGIWGTLGFYFFSHRKKEQRDDSQIYVETSIDLINKAYEILNSQGRGLTTDRVSWVSAARLISRAMDLSRKIPSEPHRKIFASEHDHQRHRFGDLLTINGKALPTEFFLGNGYIPESIGESACLTTTEWIPPQIVAVIYRFRLFPEGYKDAIETSERLSRKELERLWIFDEEGAHDYFVFRHYFRRAPGNVVYKVRDVPKPTIVSAETIDNDMLQLSGRYIDERDIT